MTDRNHCMPVNLIKSQNKFYFIKNWNFDLFFRLRNTENLLWLLIWWFLIYFGFTADFWDDQKNSTLRYGLLGLLSRIRNNQMNLGLYLFSHNNTIYIIRLCFNQSHWSCTTIRQIKYFHVLFFVYSKYRCSYSNNSSEILLFNYKKKIKFY